MRYAYFGFGMLLFGAIGLVIIVMFETITLNNDSEYYVLKEAMEAAMLESVDLSCYRLTTNVNENGCNGSLKISEQKFVENFTRRFATSISGDVDDYTIEFYDIMEKPPKATVIIKSKNTDYSLVTDQINIANDLSAILEVRGGGQYSINEEQANNNDSNVAFDNDNLNTNDTYKDPNIKLDKNDPNRYIGGCGGNTSGENCEENGIPSDVIDDSTDVTKTEDVDISGTTTDNSNNG